jgi:HrpA-like RNA helicase
VNYLNLPVYQHQDRILRALETSQTVVVESPTGSGKTTQLPVILHDAGYGDRGIIGVTQPRRIAALSVSDFIARQMGFAASGASGCPVGYKMRFEDRTGPATRIKIMTDGILLQEMKLDPWLSRYGVMIIDEAHERSLNIDFILGLLKRVLEERKDFKVIVSSATINAEVFSEYFGECPVVKIDARTFPVTLVYDPPLPVGGRVSSGEGGRKSGSPGGGGGTAAAAEALLDKITAIVERFISEKRPGDILVFLPGERMIKDCMGRLAAGPLEKHLHILPLYGRLGREEQERVFEDPPRGKTKVVLSTNIAETSVTIDGITAVLDSGLSKLNYYNPRTFISSLVESPVSKASANQRKGRAGRTREGTCYRLYARGDFENRPLFTTEEMYRTDLSEVVLRMADLGITGYEEFDFISPPGREGIIAAIETLNLLDALEEDRTLSATGRLMTEFPLGPRHSRIIVEAILRYPEVIEETLIAAAFLSTQSPYVLPPGEELDARRAHHRFRDPRGDFISYLNLYRTYGAAQNKERFCQQNYLDERAMAEIVNVCSQLGEILSEMKIPVLGGGVGGPEGGSGFTGPVKDYLCCVGRGLIQFVCVREGREIYRSLTADRIMIHPGSVMFRRAEEAGESPYIVAGDIVRTSRMYAMSASPLPPEILREISPLLQERLGPPLAPRGGGTNRESRDVPRRGVSDGGFPAGGFPEKRRKSRDFTSNIKLGTEIFPIVLIKGKKQVELPWERLINLKGPGGELVPAVDPGQYRGLRGIITLKNQYTILAGEKLSLILRLLPGLDLEEALNRNWPRKERFNSSRKESLAGLIEKLPLALRPALHGKGPPPREGRKELGFIALFTGGDGTYWFRCSRGFHTALNESMASMEALIDDLGEDVDSAVKQEINQSYRRLADILGD